MTQVRQQCTGCGALVQKGLFIDKNGYYWHAHCFAKGHWQSYPLLIKQWEQVTGPVNGSLLGQLAAVVQAQTAERAAVNSMLFNY